MSPVDAPHGATTSLDEEPVDEGLGAPERDANESDPRTVEPETTVGVAEHEEPLDGVGGEGIVARIAPVVSDHEESPPSEGEFGSAVSAPPADVPN